MTIRKLLPALDFPFFGAGEKDKAFCEDEEKRNITPYDTFLDLYRNMFPSNVYSMLERHQETKLSYPGPDENGEVCLCRGALFFLM